MTLGVEMVVEVGGQRYTLVDGSLREAISERTAASVVIAAGVDVDLDEMVTQPAALTVSLGDREPRMWTLVVRSVDLVGYEGGLVRYRLELRDPLWLLELSRNTRKFRDLATEAIVDRALVDGGLAARWETARRTELRPWCVQYRETSLAFVERLLAFEGIYYRFDEDGTPVFADDSTHAEPIAGDPLLELVQSGDALTGAPGILEVGRGARVSSGAVTLNDSNWKNPQLGLLQTRAADRDGELEIYEYPAGYRDPGVGAVLAELRLQALRARARYLSGQSSALTMSPAAACQLGQSVAAVYDGRCLVTSVTHRFHNPAFAANASARVYDNDFEAIPIEQPFRPPPPSWPVLAGHHTAMVRGPGGEEIHTDVHGRYKAQFHWDREARGNDGDSRWMRILQEAGSGMALARVGWEMNVAYIGGDPDRPVGLARNINGAMTPSYGLPANKTMMTAKTPSSPATGGYSELSLEDKAGGQKFALRAERDMVGVVKNDRTETVGQNDLQVLGAALTRAIQQNHSVLVVGNRATAVNGKTSLQVSGNRARTVGASETVSVALGAAVATAGNEREEVGSTRTTVAGSFGAPSAAGLSAALLPSPQDMAAKAVMSAIGGGGGGGGGMLSAPSLSGLAGSMMSGAISRLGSASIQRTIGGVMLSAAAGDISIGVKGSYAETVGGVKITLARDGIAQSVGALLATTVGGAMLRTAKEDIVMTAKLQRVSAGALASLSAGKSMSIKTKMVTIQMAAGLTLRAKDTAIVMDPAVVTVEGDVTLDAGSGIQVVGVKREDLTKA